MTATRTRGCARCRWLATCAWTCNGREEPVSHQLAKLAATARLTDGAVHIHYFTLTVASAPYTECRSS
jgi:hypothetical protein